MKTTLLVCVILLTTSYVTSKVFDPTAEESQAMKECNASGLRERVISAVIGSERLTFDNATKCSLFCVLKKLNYVDNDADLLLQPIMNHTITLLPQLTKYSQVLLFQLFQIQRTGLKFDDKCIRALMNYYRYTESVFVLQLTEASEDDFQLANDINNAIKEGKHLSKEYIENTKAYLAMMNAVLKIVAAGASYIATKV